MNNDRVPFFSLESKPSHLKEELLQKISTIVSSGLFINGPYLEKFQKNWAKYIGTKAAVGVGNGLDGLSIALKAVGIQPGDRVAVPAHTFIASLIAIHNIGAIPVGVDVNLNGLMNLADLEKLDVPIRAVMPVHMHGAMVDMKSLTALAKSKNWMVVEDASQAHGATQNGIKAGAWGHAGVFSLYPTKNLGAIGDAGVIVTNNLKLAEVMRSLGNYGSSKENKYKHELLGGNSRLDEIQAAAVDTSLKYLDEWNNKRIAIGARYSEALFGWNLSEIELQGKEIRTVRHHFPIVIPNRIEFIEQLSSLGIQTEIHYPFVAANEYEQLVSAETKIYPVAERISEQIVSLPMSPWMSNEDVSKVISALKVSLTG